MKQPKKPSQSEVTTTSIASHAAKQGLGGNSASDAPEQFVITSLRLPKALHQKLRRISFEDEVSIHSVVLDGIEMAIKKRGR